MYKTVFKACFIIRTYWKWYACGL